MAKQHGIDITDQRARQIRQTDLDDFDLILAMDRDNYHALMGMAKKESHRQKIHLIMNFARPNRDEIVPDPYYNNRFEQTYQLLSEACKAILKAEL
jgi:protein-tyrosine phosphatase